MPGPPWMANNVGFSTMRGPSGASPMPSTSKKISVSLILAFILLSSQLALIGCQLLEASPAKTRESHDLQRRFAFGAGRVHNRHVLDFITVLASVYIDEYGRGENVLAAQDLGKLSPDRSAKELAGNVRVHGVDTE